MRWIVSQLRGILRRDTLDRELDDEIATHLQLATAALEARGMVREEARRTALKDFGAVSRIKQEERDARCSPLFAAMWTVCGDAARLFRTDRRLSVAAIVTLALGTGATAAVYSVVNGVLLKPLPFPEPDRLVALYHVT